MLLATVVSVHALTAGLLRICKSCSRSNTLGVCCRLCQGCAVNDSILLAALGANLPGKAVMLQASGSFFAYEPILKALQSSQDMPLADFIASPEVFTATVQAPVAPQTSLLQELLQHGSKLFGHATPGACLTV